MSLSEVFRYFGAPAARPPVALLLLAHRARAEAQHASADVGEREHDAPAEAVVGASVLLGALREPGRVELGLGEPAAPGREQHAVPRARGVADAELAQNLLAQAATLQVLARAPRLGRFPQVALVVGRGPRQQLQQPLAAAAALDLARVLLLALQLDPVAFGQQLQGAFEVHPFGLLHEREDVAGGLAAEAVVDLLAGIDPERRRALLVERAQPLVAARTGAPQLGARRDQLDHVDRVAHAVLGLGGVESHAELR